MPASRPAWSTSHRLGSRPARQVLASSGPSGENLEYVLRLAEALREICPDLDAKVEEALSLADRVRHLADCAGVNA